MKKLISLILIVVTALSFATPAFAALTPEEQEMMDAIDSHHDELHEIATKIWNFAEVGWQEVESSKLLAAEFEALGFDVELGLTGKHPTLGHDIDMPTAFKATYKGLEGGPTIGILLEYDALPNGHSCGHNLIATSGVAAAIALQEAFKKTPGTVIAYGTPAEELEGSKHFMVEAGYFDGVDLVLGSHSGDFWNTEVNGKAIVWPTHDNWLTFKGKASHASAAPEKGRSALDAVMLTAMALEFTREHMPETNRIHYIISNGGAASNVVPDTATLNLEIRANETSELNNLRKRVDDIIKGAELMTGTTAVYQWDAAWNTATQVPSLYQKMAEYSVDLGVPYEKFVFGTKPSASSDLGCVAYVIPTAEIKYPIHHEGEQPPAGHSDEKAAITATEYAIDQSILAGKIMALTGFRIGTNPEELAKIKAEFAENYSE